MSVMKPGAAIVATALLAAAVPGVANAQDVADPARLREYVGTYEAAWNTHDAAAVAAFFSEDADMVFGNLPAVVGRASIEAWWRAYFQGQEPERLGKFDATSVRILTPDVALVNVASTTGATGGGAAALPVRRARGTWLVRRHGRDWLITALRGFPTRLDSVALIPSRATAESLKPRIRAFVRAYEDAFNAHDPAAIGAFYTDDADIVVRNSPVVHGRQAVLDWWQTYFADARSYPRARSSWFESMRAILIIDEIRMLGPDLALLNITATGAPRRTDAGPLSVRDARATWVIVRGEGEAGEWRIAALRVLPGEADRVIRRFGQ